MNKTTFGARICLIAFHVRLLAGVSLICLPSALALAAGWQIVPSGNQGSLGNHLFGVAAVSPSDVWAVGDYDDGPYKFFARTLTQHWDGTQWRILPSPNPFTGSNDIDVLRAVTAITSDDVWAVGYDGDDSGLNTNTLAIHWDRSAWNVVPTPNPSAVNYLYGVTAIAPDDIWAVGYYTDQQRLSASLTLHWDGSNWSSVPNPGISALRGVSAVSTNDVWAVSEGSEFLHWDGNSWSLVRGPQRFLGYLEAVIAISSDDVWAVGYQQVVYDQNTVTVHWNGSKWTLVQAINPQDEAGFYGVTALATNNVFAVGFQSSKPLVENWNGRRWSLVDTPSVGTFPTFQAIDAVTGSNSLWAVGWDYQQTNVAKTLTETNTH